MALTVVLAALPAFGSAAKTEVMVFFDAEDFTSDRANDTIRDLANLCTEEALGRSLRLSDILRTKSCVMAEWM